MEPIIAPISVDVLKSELTAAKKLRDTNKSKNEIYVITHHDSPNVMMEIGRLREEAFRDSGGGSGLSMDLDEFDTMENPYQQLIVWDPDAEKILGGYRFILGNEVKLDENAAYALGKRELTARIREGLLEWQLTQWDRLHSDLHMFINRYPASALDIDLQMGLVACITHGFNVMDAEKYRQCKILYKQTERMYKHHLKMLKIQQDAAMTDSVNAYSEQRLQYKKCRNNYLNTKLAWKIVFTIFKKLAFH